MVPTIEEKTMEPINRNSLFLEESLSIHCSNACKAAKREIDKLTSVSIDGIRENEIVNKLYDGYKVEAPIITVELSNCLHEKHSNNTVVYHIPFTGKGELFNLKPSKWTTAEPYGNVKSNEILIEYPLRNSNERDVANLINKEFGDNYENIIKWLGFVSKDCEIYNKSLRETIEKYVKAKYEEINESDGTYKNL
jgi:hypothetical protein